MPTAGGVIRPQAPERPQPILGVVKASPQSWRGPCCRPCLVAGPAAPPTINHQRCTHCGAEASILVARIPRLAPGPESWRARSPRAPCRGTSSSSDKAHPEGRPPGGGQWLPPIDPLAAWAKKAQSSAARQIVDFPERNRPAIRSVERAAASTFSAPRKDYGSTRAVAATRSVSPPPPPRVELLSSA